MGVVLGGKVLANWMEQIICALRTKRGVVGTSELTEALTPCCRCISHVQSLSCGIDFDKPLVKNSGHPQLQGFPGCKSKYLHET